MLLKRCQVATLRGMHCRTGLFAVVAHLVACNPGELDLRFVVPATYVEATSSVTLRLFLPTDDVHDCNDLALGWVAAEPVQATAVTDRTHVPLDNVPREGAKLFVAEGFDVDGVRLVAGCAGVGRIDDDTAITIDAEPSISLARIDTASDDPLSTQVQLPAQVEVEVRDVRGAAASGVSVEWRLLGTGNREVRGGAVGSDATGLVQLTADGELIPGPFEMQLRGRWLDGPALSVSGLVPPRAQAVVLSGVAAGARGDGHAPIVGTLGPSGELGVAMPLLTPGDGLQVALATFDSTGDELAATVRQSAPLPMTASAVLALGHGAASGADTLVIAARDLNLSSLSFWRFAVDATTLTASSPTVRTLSTLALTDPAPSVSVWVPERLVEVPACGGQTVGPFLLQLTERNVPPNPASASPAWTRVFVDEQFARVQSPFASMFSALANAHVVAAGCIGDARDDAVSYPCLVAEVGNDTDRFVIGALVGEVLGVTTWNASGGHAAFTPALAESPPALLGLLRAGLSQALYLYRVADLEPAAAAGPATLLLTEVERRLAAGKAATTPLGGDFDGDGLLDIAYGWGDDSAAATLRLALSRGQGFGNAPMVAHLVTGLASLGPRTSVIAVNDVDGDGAGDVLLFEPSDSAVPQLFVVQLGVSASGTP